jgi:hypothetical protein
MGYGEINPIVCRKFPQGQNREGRCHVIEWIRPTLLLRFVSTYAIIPVAMEETVGQEGCKR